VVTAIPTIEEIVVMIPVLWSDTTTPFPSQVKGDKDCFETLEAKVEEIRKRCELMGPYMRIPFRSNRFASHLMAIVAESDTTGMAMSAQRLHLHYNGTKTTADGEASSISSKMYLLDSVKGDSTHEDMLATLNPVAKFKARLRLEALNADFCGGEWAVFEGAASYYLQVGGVVGDTRLRKRDMILPPPTSKRGTANVMLTMPLNGKVGGSGRRHACD